MLEDRIREQQDKAVAEQTPNSLAGQGGLAGATGRAPIIERLYNKRHTLVRRLEQVDNTIRFLEKNQNVVEIFEVLMQAEGKADPFGL